MKKIIFTSLLVLCACVQGTVKNDVSKTEMLTFPGIPIPVSIDATVDTTTALDVHDAISSIQKVGNVSLSFTQNSLSYQGDPFVHHIKVDIVPTSGNMPEKVMSDFDVSATSNVLDIPISMSNDDLASYLGGGEVQLHFWLTGSIPESNTTMTHAISFHAEGSVDKGIGDIGK